jgi:hypothetical protein
VPLHTSLTLFSAAQSDKAEPPGSHRETIGFRLQATGYGYTRTANGFGYCLGSGLVAEP